jgi:hypothetical protein
MGKHFTLFLVAILALAADTAHSEDALQAGARVRVNLAGGRRITGTLVSLRGGTLVVRPAEPGSAPREFNLEKIENLQVPGRRRSRGRGALKGAAIGALVAGPTFGLLCASDGSELITPAACAAGYTVLGALVGAAIGTLRTQPEGWQKVPLEELRLSLRPTRGRGIAASLSWSLR